MSVEVSGRLKKKKIQVTMDVWAEEGYPIPIEQIQAFFEGNVVVNSTPSFSSITLEVKLKNKITSNNERIEIEIEIDI